MATTDHFKTLAQDDPEFMSRDEARWIPVEPSALDPRPMFELNEALEWREALVAIRGMNRNTAPGKCGMHVNTLKALVSEECMAHLEQVNPSFVHPDNVRVDLAEEDLPSIPTTPMGGALWKVLLAIWDLEVIPALWNEVYIVSLLKSGDPELLTNYRGISLISVSLKILSGIMVDHLGKAVDNHGLLPIAQSGFRKREEAIAQFLVMAEVVRRCHLVGASTIGIFIDFKKAYDKVCHEWGEKWGMELGLAKCGVMLWSNDSMVKADFESTTFMTPIGEIPKVSSYKYLGIIVTNYLGVFMGKDPAMPIPEGCTDAMNHALAQAAKGLKALGTLKPLLLDKFCPVPLKVELVRSLVYPIMTYGGEFIGFNKRLALPMQRVVDMAT
ncbi:hypothetical protein K503DRAFT_806411 [Rhizopogon vinicolor AM-OR11-026]|uniref:Reverse transcriptase domain-containing protein n=1 Tax=Rhizopogon vinicolor AM-OR11-026 TaxID=1314800 RepID=A0A1B7MEL6_9AGAM|nr:hypothetical protein K503DRAFT_806411 [Rhizopogon vinicolor AM-OR11-026]